MAEEDNNQNNYNNENNFDTQRDTSNFAADQLQQIGYKYA